MVESWRTLYSCDVSFGATSSITSAHHNVCARPEDLVLLKTGKIAKVKFFRDHPLSDVDWEENIVCGVVRKPYDPMRPPTFNTAHIWGWVPRSIELTCSSGCFILLRIQIRFGTEAILQASNHR